MVYLTSWEISVMPAAGLGIRENSSLRDLASLVRSQCRQGTARRAGNWRWLTDEVTYSLAEK